MEQQQTSPQPPALSSVEGPSLITPYATRHDGWTGEKMATFCEALAETAVVAEACDAARMGISGAYAARRRNPVFSAAWDAALSIARERLADTLLARSMEGNVEQMYRDGELVGERHVIDNKLGLAILRRLDRLAEGGVSVSARDLPFSGQYRKPAPSHGSFNWEHAIDALRTGDDEGVARALALIGEPVPSPSKGDKVEEVEALRDGPAGEEEDDTLDLSDRCWWDELEECWMTDFPPPAGFDGYDSRPYDDFEDDEPYIRACTGEEVAILDADRAADRALERAEDEALRDEWFALLRNGQSEGPCTALDDEDD